MRYLTLWLVGCMIGAGLGGALLYYNPLLGSEAPLPTANDWVLSYGLPGVGAFTHGDKILYPRQPAGTEVLWEDTLERIGVGALPLASDGSATADVVASRISVPSAATDFLTRGPLLTDYWLLTVPGQGSLLLQIDSELWPFFKDALLPVRYLGRSWQGPATYEPTRGPRSDGAGRVIGASGRFRATGGSVVERYALDDFGGREARFRAELSVHFDPAAAGAATP